MLRQIWRALFILPLSLSRWELVVTKTAGLYCITRIKPGKLSVRSPLPHVPFGLLLAESWRAGELESWHLEQGHAQLLVLLVVNSCQLRSRRWSGSGVFCHHLHFCGQLSIVVVYSRTPGAGRDLCRVRMLDGTVCLSCPVASKSARAGCIAAL